MTEKDLEIQKLRAEVKKLTARAEKAEAQLAAPTADVEPVVQGEWVKQEHESDSDECVCSVCGGDAPAEFGRYTWIKSDRCPNCGAHMDGRGKT